MQTAFRHKMYENKKALVIEDVPAMRELLVELLRMLGFKEIVRCEDGASALKAMEHSVHHFDVIICDIEMPIIDGIEFVQMLRTHKRFQLRNTPVIMVTAHSEHKNLSKALKSGVQGFLVKPMSLAALDKSIKRALKNAPINPDVLSRNTQHKLVKHVPIIEG